MTNLLRRALVTGARGQLGLELVEHAPPGWAIAAYGASELDVTQPDVVRRVIHAERPEVVIHTAAYTAVDRAETAFDAAERVNSEGAAHVAEAVQETGGRMLQVSTDYVFDGSRTTPYRPTDSPNPLGAYGRTKLSGEREVRRILGEHAVVVRTAWLYSARGHNFVLTMLRLMREQREVRVVSDQIGTPTWARSLAGALWRFAMLPQLAGTYHWTDAGAATWYDFAAAIQEEALALGLLERAVPLIPILSSEFGGAAPRPGYSVLDASSTWSALDLQPPHWRVNLRLMLQDLTRG